MKLKLIRIAPEHAAHGVYEEGHVYDVPDGSIEERTMSRFEVGAHYVADGNVWEVMEL